MKCLFVQSSTTITLLKLKFSKSTSFNLPSVAWFYLSLIFLPLLVHYEPQGKFDWKITEPIIALLDFDDMK